MENILTASKILNYTDRKAVFCQIILLGAALVLPSVCHYLNLPVTRFLPMHWPLLLAGLVYGWRSGLILGLLAPLLSFAFSGMPPAAILPAMVLELAAYGFITGLCREQFKFNSFVSVIAALALGKILFLCAAGLPAASLYAGIWAFAGQLIVLPALAYQWTKNQ